MMTNDELLIEIKTRAAEDETLMAMVLKGADADVAARMNKLGLSTPTIRSTPLTMMQAINRLTPDVGVPIFAEISLMAHESYSIARLLFHWFTSGNAVDFGGPAERAMIQGLASDKIEDVSVTGLSSEEIAALLDLALAPATITADQVSNALAPIRKNNTPELKEDWSARGK